MLEQYFFRRENSPSLDSQGDPFRVIGAKTTSSRKSKCIELNLKDAYGKPMNYGISGYKMQEDFLTEMRIEKPEELIGRNIFRFFAEDLKKERKK